MLLKDLLGKLMCKGGTVMFGKCPESLQLSYCIMIVHYFSVRVQSLKDSVQEQF